MHKIGGRKLTVCGDVPEDPLEGRHQQPVLGVVARDGEGQEEGCAGEEPEDLEAEDHVCAGRDEQAGAEQP